MAYDPSKVRAAPPRYRPAEAAGDEEAGPVYNDDDPTNRKDFMKAANRAP